MGMFTTLFRDRKCERCGETYKCSYQFKTGNDFCEDFKNGDLVPEKFPRPAVFEACFYPVCGFCREFVHDYVERLKKDAEEVILRSDYEIRKSGVAAHVWKAGREIASYMWTGWLASPKPGKAFKALEAKIVERWRRQVKAAGIGKWVRLTQERGKRFIFDVMDVYSVGIGERVLSEAARVHLGKRFRLEPLDTGGEDGAHWLFSREFKTNQTTRAKKTKKGG